MSCQSTLHSQIQERYDTLNKSFAGWEAKMKAVENNLVTAKIPLQEPKGDDSTYGKTSSTLPGPPAGDDSASEKNSQVASEDGSDILAFGLATALKQLGEICGNESLEATRQCRRMAVL
jgi:hypothetical protein